MFLLKLNYLFILIKTCLNDELRKPFSPTVGKVHFAAAVRVTVSKANQIYVL